MIFQKVMQLAEKVAAAINEKQVIQSPHPQAEAENSSKELDDIIFNDNVRKIYPTNKYHIYQRVN